MTTIKKYLIKALNCSWTFGFKTKNARREIKLEKSHANDAFVIAGGGAEQARAGQFNIKQRRRNNRALSKFYDAQYIDTRTGEKATGKELFCGRTTRNKNLNTENLKQYRGEKVRKGRFSIRRQRYFYQAGDIVKIEKNRKCLVKGVYGLGRYIRLLSFNGIVLNKRISLVSLVRFGKGLCFA